MNGELNGSEEALDFRLDQKGRARRTDRGEGQFKRRPSGCETRRVRPRPSHGGAVTNKEAVCFDLKGRDT